MVILSTGSQGEPLSALRRMAYRDHPQVIAARRRHRRLLGDAGARQRARGRRDDRPPLPHRLRGDHDAGRADPRLRPRLRRGAEADAQPHAAALRDAVPRRLQADPPARGRSPRPSGSSAPSIFCAENGDVLELDSRGARFGKPEHAGMIFVDGVDIGDVADSALRDRRMLSADGIFIVVATISEEDGRSVADPEVIFRGVAFLDEAGRARRRDQGHRRGLARRRRRRGRARRRRPPAAAPRPPRRADLRAAAAPADGASGRGRGLSSAAVAGRRRPLGRALVRERCPAAAAMPTAGRACSSPAALGSGRLRRVVGLQARLLRLALAGGNRRAGGR